MVVRADVVQGRMAAVATSLWTTGAPPSRGLGKRLGPERADQLTAIQVLAWPAGPARQT